MIASVNHTGLAPPAEAMDPLMITTGDSLPVVTAPGAIIASVPLFRSAGTITTAMFGVRHPVVGLMSTLPLAVCMRILMMPAHPLLAAMMIRIYRQGLTDALGLLQGVTMVPMTDVLGGR